MCNGVTLKPLVYQSAYFVGLSLEYNFLNGVSYLSLFMLILIINYIGLYNFWGSFFSIVDTKGNFFFFFFFAEDPM